MSVTSCTFLPQMDAYHDGALDTATRGLIERHLPTCGECSGYLESLRRMSRWFAESGDSDISGIELARIHVAVDSEMDAAVERAGKQAGTERGFGRVAMLVSALAASVVIIGSVWLVEIAPSRGTSGNPSPSSVVSSAADWEKVAMTLQVDPIPGEEVRTASASDLSEWMLEQVIGKGGPTHP